MIASRREVNVPVRRYADVHSAAVRIRVCVGAVLAAVTVAAYAGIRHHQFLNFDDPAYVTSNPMVAGGLSIDGLKWAFTTSHAGNWHPVTWLSHMTDVSLCGLAPGCHHLTSLVLHILSALLLLRFLARATGRLWPSACVAGLFALHPLHVESVAWIAERKDVLSTFWWMAAINIYASAWPIYASAGPRPTAGRYVALLGTSALAMLSKPMAVTLPFTLMLLDVWPLRRGALKDRLRVLWPLFLMTAAISIVTIFVQRQAGAVQSMETFPLLLRMANVPIAYGAYLLKTVWPLGLAPLYPYPESLPFVKVIACVLVLAAITAVALRLRARHPVVLVGWLWFAGTLVPVIGLVQVGAQPYADRYTYVPLIGVFLMVIWPAADALRSQRGRAAAGLGATALAVVLTVLTWRQVAHWRDSITLWTHTSNVTDANYRAYTNLGHALDQAASSTRAEAAYRQALQLKPDYANARNYLGALLLDRQRPAEAEVELRAALAVRPRFAEARNSLGLALAAQNRQAEAIREFETALSLAPSFAQARNNLGIALARSGRLTEAIAAFEASLRQQPRSAEVHLNLAVALLDAGRPQAARPHLAAAVEYGHGILRETAQKLLLGLVK